MREGLVAVDHVGSSVMQFPPELNQYDVLIDSYIVNHPDPEYDKNIANFLRADKGLLCSSMNVYDGYSGGNEFLSKYGIAWVSKSINFGSSQDGAAGIPINHTQLDLPIADSAIMRVTQGGGVSDQDGYTIALLFATDQASTPLISTFLQFRQTGSYFRYLGKFFNLSFGASLLVDPPCHTMEIPGDRISAQAGEPLNVES